MVELLTTQLFGVMHFKMRMGPIPLNLSCFGSGWYGLFGMDAENGPKIQVDFLFIVLALPLK